MAELPGEPASAEYGLVLPFVVCASKGGPYEDAAFVAGYTAGEIGAALRFMTIHNVEMSWYVPSGVVPQMDLLAMHYGWVMTTLPWEEHPEEWTQVTFAKPAPQPLEESP